MKKPNSYKLIDGKFPSADASQILSEIITNKITYHNRQILSNQERFNGNTGLSEKRIKELSKLRATLKKELEIAAKKELLVGINCVIELEFIKPGNTKKP
jgi:hypothetical protein